MRQQSGDTLVEVLIATAILGAAVVVGLGIMNFGFGTILNSIERTKVQASVNSQLSLIQFVRDAYVRAGRQATPSDPAASTWAEIVNNIATTIYSSDVCMTNAAPNTAAVRNPFYINADGTAPVVGIPASATSTPTTGNGLWVEAVRPSGANYVDFYVKACWQPAAGATNQESRSTMRLYAP